MSSDEEKSGYIKLYTYFYTRQRIGVVGNCYSGVKDMYILPLASHDAIPEELKPLPGKNNKVKDWDLKRKLLFWINFVI